MKKRISMGCAIIISAFSFSQNLKELITIDDDLEEVSALERIAQSDHFWVIEDAGNDSKLYALDSHGKIKREIEITNAENDDWEDLTSDAEGNLYIGDFGNNSEERKTFNIYKVNYQDLTSEEVTAKRITFRLPADTDSRDFEAFFIWQNHFYIFSKEKKKPIVISVPNKMGTHTAKIVSKLDIKGKDNEITSADISPGGQTIALLNHEKVWLLHNFQPNDFSRVEMTTVDFDHESQKEGLYFESSDFIYISDERDGNDGGRIYKLTLAD